VADDLRRQLGELVTQLLQEYQHGGRGESVAPLLRGHLGDDAGSLPILTESLEDWELPNLQLGLEAVLARDGWSASTSGSRGRRGATSSSASAI
jgi:hypothetical protein